MIKICVDLFHGRAHVGHDAKEVCLFFDFLKIFFGCFISDPGRTIICAVCYYIISILLYLANMSPHDTSKNFETT